MSCSGCGRPALPSTPPPTCRLVTPLSQILFPVFNFLRFLFSRILALFLGLSGRQSQSCPDGQKPCAGSFESICPAQTEWHYCTCVCLHATCLCRPEQTLPQPGNLNVNLFNTAFSYVLCNCMKHEMSLGDLILLCNTIIKSTIQTDDIFETTIHLTRLGTS